ncbi:MAG: hypothetical protein JW860_14195 [Sedimentisphaerales bacterium]|nr:hypothetical protein [Sedimentisphaerales bacterium]
MIIKFRCSICSKKIGVPIEYAGKRVKCPQCANPVGVPKVKLHEQPQVIDKPQPAPPQPQTIKLPPSVPTPTTPQTIPQNNSVSHQAADPFPGNIWTDELLAASQSAAAEKQNKEKVYCPKCNSPIYNTRQPCEMCGYIYREEETKSDKSQPVPLAERTFGKDLIRLMPPAKNWKDSKIIIYLLFMSIFAALPLPFIWIFQILVSGVICNFLFNVVVTTANGNDNLPEFEMESMIRSYLQMLISGFYAFLPMIIWMILFSMQTSDTIADSRDFSVEAAQEQSYYSDNQEGYGQPDENPDYSEEFYQEEEPYIQQDEVLAEPEDTYDEEGEFYTEQNNLEDGFFDEENDSLFEMSEEEKENFYSFLLQFKIVFFLCLFFWPMVLMTIALGDTFIINPVKLIKNIINTFIPYLICCACLYAVTLLVFLFIGEYAVITASLGNNIAMLIVVLLLIACGMLCIEIYTMRVLGLLYRYYGNRLDM